MATRQRGHGGARASPRPQRPVPACLGSSRRPRAGSRGGAPQEPYVVNGQDAPAGAWPDVANIDLSCTGTLIHPRFVLTAEHCLGRNRAAAVGFVRRQDMFASEGPPDGTDIVEIAQVHRPDLGDYYDIGLVELARPVVGVPPRTLARDCVTEDWLDVGSAVAIVGWGATDAFGRGSSAGTLQQGFTEVQTPACDAEFVDSNGYDIWTGCNPRIAPGGEVGAGGNDVDACFGDSGGPLYIDTPTGWYVLGVTSRAYGGVGVTSDRAPCRYGGIYTRPDAVLDWIESVIGEPLPRPICTLLPSATATPLALRPGQRRVLEVEVDDPDGEQHTLEVATPPAHGEVEITKGKVRYTASPDHVGPDPFTLRVVDDGTPDWPDNPPGVVEVLAQVDVFEGKPPEDLKPYVRPCGCASSGSGLSVWGALIGAGLLRRRTRRSPT